MTALDISALERLELLWCGINRLTALDAAACKNLTQLRCYRNMIASGAMDALLQSLAASERGWENSAVRQVRILAAGDKMTNGKPSALTLHDAKEKGWEVLDSADIQVLP